MPFDIEFRAREKERRRIAKELHDAILPALSRLTRCVQEHGSPNSVDFVEMLHGTVAAFRDFLGELHPVDLEELGLVAALSNLCARYARLSGLCICFDERVEDYILDRRRQLALYRAMQLVLRLFVASDNDILIVACDQVQDRYVITARCVDKSVAWASWLSPENEGFEDFEDLLSLAGAQSELGTMQYRGFPFDLMISIPAGATGLAGDETEAPVLFECIDAASRPALIETLAIESERRTITGEISRSLAARLKRMVECCRSFASESLADEVGAKLVSIERELAGVLDDLHPRLLAQTSLTSSMRTLIDGFESASNIEATKDFDPAVEHLELSGDVKFALYRVTQEALNNIEKHSRADRAHISLRVYGKSLVVRIEDNGNGFLKQRSTHSRGLRNIQDRALSIGAQVEWTRATTFDTGTLVSVCLPLSRMDKEIGNVLVEVEAVAYSS